MGHCSNTGRGLALGLVVLVAGCGGLGNPGSTIHSYDLGAPQGGAVSPGGVGTVRVVAPSWLKAPGLSYRLLYDAPGERRTYQYSRWVAPPPELLGNLLSRRLEGLGGCALEVDLDEFNQVFTSPQQSEGVIEARARLLAPQAGAGGSARTFSVRVPAPSPDGPGGAVALAQASQALVAALNTWLVTPAGQQQGGEHERCIRTNP